MGMSDKQFQSYQKSLLRHLERVLAGMEDGRAKDDLQQIVNDLRDELSRP